MEMFIYYSAHIFSLISKVIRHASSWIQIFHVFIVSFSIQNLYTNFCCRPYWRCYYSNTDAIIYVVDSMDRDRIGICKQELISMLEVRLINIYILIDLFNVNNCLICASFHLSCIFCSI